MVTNLVDDAKLATFRPSWKGFFLTTALAGAFHRPKKLWTPDFSFMDRRSAQIDAMEAKMDEIAGQS